MTRARGPLSIGALLAVLLGAACGPDEPPAPAPTAPSAPALAPVARARVEELARELGFDPPPRVPRRANDDPGTPRFGPGGQPLDAPPPASAAELALPVPSADERAEAAGLAQMLAHADASMRELALEDARTLGARGLATWLEVLGDGESDRELRRAAAELIGVVGSVGAAAHALDLCERAEDAWTRACAARALSAMPAQGWCVPRLVLRLKYEIDHEAAAWIAWSLGVQGSLAGVEALIVIERAPTQPELGLLASQLAQDLVQRHRCADPTALARSFERGEPCAADALPTLGKRYELEAWRLIDALGGWQLRDVDDARFALSRLGPTEALWIGRALGDEDRRLRSHAVQCLGRMGPRATAALPLLTAALADPSIAAQAAEALGDTGAAAAEPALRAAISAGRPTELRIAAARALARLARAESAPALEAALAPAEPFELRQAASEALLALDRPDLALPALLESLQDGGGDPGSAERALERWLDARAAAGGAGGTGAELAAAWRALAPAAGVIPSESDVVGRRRARAALLRELAGAR